MKKNDKLIKWVKEQIDLNKISLKECVREKDYDMAAKEQIVIETLEFVLEVAYNA